MENKFKNNNQMFAEEDKELIRIANKILKDHKKAFEVLGND